MTERERMMEASLDKAYQVFEEAFQRWKSLEEEKRGLFNIEWLVNNGYRNLYRWIRKAYTGTVKEFFDNAPEGIREEFSYKEPSESYTLETMAGQFEEAYRRWKESEEDNIDFDSQWLREHGFGNQLDWVYRYKRWNQLLTTVSPQIREAFVKRSSAYTKESALKKFEEAHSLWKQSPADGRRPFNTVWLTKNGFDGLAQWMRSKYPGGTEEFLSEVPPELREDFKHLKKKTTEYTLDGVIEQIEQAHRIWKEMPADSRGIFNLSWLKSNGWGGLCNWVSRQGFTLSEVITLARYNIQEDFNSPRAAYTQNTAVLRLEAAYQDWKNLPQATKSTFSSSWLQKNGYSGLVSWSEKKYPGGLRALIDLSSDDIQKSFTYPLERYTTENAIAKLKIAYQQWEDLPADKRRTFSKFWLRNNGFEALCRWLDKQYPGGLASAIDEVHRLLQTEPSSPGEQKTARVGEVEEVRLPAGGVLPSKMIDLADIDLNAVLPRVGLLVKGKNPFQVENTRGTASYDSEPSELQRLRYAIGHALVSGEWSNELVEQYIELHSHLPDFLFHRLSAHDIIRRAQRGQITLPRTILSVAGGAYGELIAWNSLTHAQTPTIVTMDHSRLLLEKAKEKISKKYHISLSSFHDFEGDMYHVKRDTLAYYAPYYFDLVECSAMDNLRSENEKLIFVEEAADLIKEGQMVQILSRDPLPVKVYQRLPLMQCIALTPRDALLVGDAADLKGAIGQKEYERIQQKLREGRYYLLIQKVALPDREIQEERILLDTLSSVRGMPQEEQRDALSQLVMYYPRLKEIPDERLKQAGFKREVIKSNSKKYGDIVRLKRIGDV